MEPSDLARGRTVKPLVAQASTSLVEDLNRWCRCIAVDPRRLEAALEAQPATAGLYGSILARQPNLFAETAVFVSRAQLEEMRRVIAAVEALVALEAYRDLVLARAPAIARIAHGPRGAFLGYDFHVAPDGPRLIEVNTNAGGALLNTALAAAELACCPEVATLIAGPSGGRLAFACNGSGDESEPAASDVEGARPEGCGDQTASCTGARIAGDGAAVEARAVEAAFLDMFREEWRLQRGAAPLCRVAIVDDEPEAQFLYPEFLLFRELFAAAGIAAEVADPRELERAGGGLRLRGEPVDLVYNRLTDFYLAEPRHAALREAYVAGEVVLTPHPRAHALYADKRNLAVLSDPGLLRTLKAPEEAIEALSRGVPRTVEVDAARADEWWRERKRWFFKPVDGYGGKATYRGDKLTRAAFAALGERPYVAQAVVPPSERTIVRDGDEVRLKLDLRNYVYAGRVQLVAARLYQGQTTNFRTPGGGFAPVFSERP